MLNKEEIKAKISFDMLIQELCLSYYRAQGNHLCMFHNDINPSLSRAGYCFACRKKYDVFDLYQFVNSCSFIEALNGLSEHLH